MRKRLVVPFLWAFFVSSLSATDFQPIKTNYLLSFDIPNELFVFGSGKLWVDSTKINFDGSTSYYPSKDILQLDYYCFSPYGSVLGKEIRMGADSIVFINYLDEEIVIKPTYTPDVYWKAFKRADSIVVMAKVDAALSTTDSKTIKFQVYDGTMNPISSNLNNCSIELTRTGGISKTINLYAFPFHEFSVPAEELIVNVDTTFSLSNQKNSNLTWKQVHDFQAGDEIHVLEQNNYVNPDIENYKRKIIKKYLSRTESVDTTIYTIDRISEKVTLGNVFISYKHDTITEKIYPNPDFDKLIGTAIVNMYANEAYVMTGDTNHKTIPNTYSTVYSYSSTCFAPLIGDGCFPEESFYRGLGGPYSYCDDGFNGGTFESNCVYYKKGSTSSGTPLVLTAVNENKIAPACSVIPNPAKTNIQVRTAQPFPADFAILNLSGKVILSTELKSSEETINIENIPQGVYLYQIRFSNKQMETGKLVKE
ncbi:MAG: T9SS type A sorting domain-containing protein [Paludibacteraceae bacterium]|nr:T9SS type A sorting domain-containing protein [Paludibacteraceae bacterium]MBN2787437.1 T9SS type A sorting domain-containing protein [Paludibacteraceae bacterium]